METSLTRMTSSRPWRKEQHITMMIMLDLSAAFDVVDHNIILKILESQFGVTDAALKWFDNYLRATCYCALINKVVPESVTINDFVDDHFL